MVYSLRTKRIEETILNCSVIILGGDAVGIIILRLLSVYYGIKQISSYAGIFGNWDFWHRKNEI